MRSRRTERFKERLLRLPPPVRQDALKAYRLFRSDPSHNSLEFKPLKDKPHVYSVRVGRQYRALGIREGDLITWFWIGSHADYDQLLKRL